MDGLFYIGPYPLRLILVKGVVFKFSMNDCTLATNSAHKLGDPGQLKTRKSAEHHVVVRGIGQAVLPAMSSQQAACP